MIFLLVVGLAALAGYTYNVGRAQVQEDANRADGSRMAICPLQGPAPAESKTIETTPATPWDGLVRLQKQDAEAIGLFVPTVQPQIEPIKLPLMGRTDYDPNTLSKIRPRFDTLVEKVRAELGQKVKKGYPLVDLFSTELAAAKNDFQTAYVQWQHDLRLLEMRKKLFNRKRSPSRCWWTVRTTRARAAWRSRPPKRN